MGIPKAVQKYSCWSVIIHDTKQDTFISTSHSLKCEIKTQ